MLKRWSVVGVKGGAGDILRWWRMHGVSSHRYTREKSTNITKDLEQEIIKSSFSLISTYPTAQNMLRVCVCVFRGGVVWRKVGPCVCLGTRADKIQSINYSNDIVALPMKSTLTYHLPLLYACVHKRMRDYVRERKERLRKFKSSRKNK